MWPGNQPTQMTPRNFDSINKTVNVVANAQFEACSVADMAPCRVPLYYSCSAFLVRVALAAAMRRRGQPDERLERMGAVSMFPKIGKK